MRFSAGDIVTVVGSSSRRYRVIAKDGIYYWVRPETGPMGSDSWGTPVTFSLTQVERWRPKPIQQFEVGKVYRRFNGHQDDPDNTARYVCVLVSSSGSGYTSRVTLLYGDWGCDKRKVWSTTQSSTSSFYLDDNQSFE